MEWVAIAVNIARDPSVHRMAEGLRVRVPEAVGLLALTFAEMAQHAPTGELADVPDSLLETWSGWHGKRGAFAEQFRANLCNHAGLVLAWEKYNGANIRRAKAASERTRTWRARKENANRTHNSTHTDTATVRDTVQYRTEQNRKDTQKGPAAPVIRAEDPRFAALWAIYPSRSGGNPRKEALAAWAARLKDGVPADVMHAGVERYRAYHEAKGTIGSEFVMQAKRFLGPTDQYLEAWTPPAAKAPVMQIVDGWYVDKVPA